MLKLIEWRWGLQPLTQRDTSTAPGDPENLATVLDLARPNLRVAASIPDLPTFVPTACPSVGAAPAASPGPAASSSGGTSSDNETWAALQHSALLAGWT